MKINGLKVGGRYGGGTCEHSTDATPLLFSSFANSEYQLSGRNLTRGNNINDKIFGRPLLRENNWSYVLLMPAFDEVSLI